MTLTSLPSRIATTHMTSRRISLILWALAALTSSSAGAQSDQTADDCSRAATLVRAYDEAAVNAGGHADQGQGKMEQRQIAAARMLSCGALGGVTAASTIRATRSLTDTTALEELVGPFRYFRDTAVVNAVVGVATDPAASVEARVFAIRAMWVLRTGKIWIFYGQMLPTAESTPANPLAACDDGVLMSHDTPFWSDGVAPPAGFEAQLLALANQLMADTSQPMAVRAAATCARRP
jgi:hypothetical protein